MTTIFNTNGCHLPRDWAGLETSPPISAREIDRFGVAADGIQFECSGSDQVSQDVEHGLDQPDANTASSTAVIIQQEFVGLGLLDMETSASAIILAAWGLVAARMSNSNDISFTVALEEPAATTCQVRLDLSGDQSISDILTAASQHGSGRCSPQRSNKSPNQQQTLLVLQREGTGETLSQDRHQRWLSTHGLVVCVSLGHTLKASACFEPGVLEQWAVRNQLSRLHHVAEQLSCSDASTRLTDIELASPDDLRQIWEWNASVPAEVKRSFCEIFDETARERPRAVAIDAWDGKLTYTRLDELASALADDLVELGVGPDVFVPLCFEKSLWTSVAVLAVAKAGGAFVLLDPSQPEHRLQTIVEQVKARIILTSTSRQLLGSRLVKASLTVDGSYFAARDERQAGRAVKPKRTIAPSLTLYAVFTSGSTGTPKGVLVSHANAASALVHQAESAGLTADTRLFDFASYSFDVSLWGILAMLAAGGCLCVPSDEDRKEKLEESIISSGANFLDLTPSTVHLVSPDRVPAVRSITLGGEALRAADLEAFWGKVKIRNVYGPSECTPSAIFNCEASSPGEATRIGKGQGAVTWVVDADDHNKLVPPGFVGELLLEGPIVGLGYLDDAARTDAAFIRDPVWLCRGIPGLWPGRRGRFYKTGDLVRYHGDGSLSYVGRKDVQVKIRGQRVELGEVEHHLRACFPEATEVIADVVAREGKGPTLAAFILMNQSPKSEASDVRVMEISAAEELDLARCLPSFMIPSVYFALDKLPITMAGKTDRNQLRRLASKTLLEMQQAPLQGGCAALQGGERSLQQIWARVLNVEAARIGADDSFFSLGGDSITAMQVSSMARAAGLDISTADMLRKKTISLIAATMPAPKPRIAPLTKQQDEDGEPFHLSPMQQLYARFEPDPTRCYDQNFLLGVRTRLTHDSLTRALGTVVSRHAMLRVRFGKTPGGEWMQRVVTGDDAARPFHLAEAPLGPDMADSIRRCRQRLDIEQGPLLAAVLLSPADGSAGQRLFICIHHLVIDLVSWRVLLQELEELVTGRQLSSPSPTMSFRTWTAMQAEYAGSKLESEWVEVTPPPLLSYWGIEAADNTQGAATLRRFTVHPETSATLLGAANGAFGTRTVEILIAALLNSFTAVFPDRPCPHVFNEGHGREPWDGDIDISRTVGWFTTMYPVHAPAVDLVDAVRGTKDCVRGLARNGWSYFTSKFASGARAAASASEFPVEVVLNFAGAYQQLERADSLFHMMPVPDGCHPPSAAGLRRFELFEFSVHVDKGQLAVTLLYPAKANHQDRIAAWMDQYQATLVHAAELLGNRPRQCTLSDFPLALKTYGSIEQFQARLLPQLGISSPDAIEDMYPCTSVQEGMLMAQAKDSTNYRSVLYFDIRARCPDEDVEFPRIENAWRAVVQRHSLLRAVLADKMPGSSRTMHVILKHVAPSVSYVPAADEAAIKGFSSDLSSPGYGKYQIQHHLSALQVHQGHVKVRLEMNHAIVDGYSDGVLLRDFWKAYNATLSPHGPLYCQFVNYLEQQQSQHQGAAADFWAAFLDGVQPCLFPASKSGREQMTASMVPVPDLDVAKVHAFCARWEVTAASVVQAAWALVLRQFTGSSSPCFGNMTSSRDAPIGGIEEMFGPVIGTTPLRVRMDTGLSVLETLRQLQRHHLDSLPYQTHSLLEIQQGLDCGSLALFNSILSFQRAQDPIFATSADGHYLEVKGIVDPVEYAISVNVEDSDAELSILLGFNAGLLDRHEAERVARTLGAAVSSLICDPDTKIGDISPLHEKDLQQLWSWNNSVPAAAERCVHELIDDKAQRQPDATAVCAWDGSLTYRELVDLATMLARRLVPLGVGTTMFVPLCFEKSMWTSVAMLGIMKTGAAFILLDPSLPEPRLGAIVNQVDAKLLLSSTLYQSLGSRLCSQVIVVDHDYCSAAGQTPSGSLPRVDLDSLNYLIFTSGSTGAPKGAMITHRVSASAVKHQVGGFGYTDSSRVYDFSPYSFDGSVLNAYTTWASGGCLCVPSDQDRKIKLEESMNSLRANAVFLTPSVAQLLTPERLPLLKVFMGGEAIRVKDVKPWWGRIATIYGPSECSPICMMNPRPSTPEEALRLGHGYGAVTWIVDPLDHNRLLPPGCPGELVLEGPLVGEGYLGNPEKTAAAFISAPSWLVRGAPGRPGRHGRLYKTGDLAHYNDDGSISFIGRKDNQVKIHGQRVELGEVEHWTQVSMPEAKEVAAEVIQPQGGSGPLLALFLYFGNSVEETPVTIIPIPAHVECVLAAHLPGYIASTVLFSVTKMPLTSSGKIDRTQLRRIGASFTAEQLAELRTAGKKRTPTSKAERRLQSIWAKVLNIEASRIGLDDSFFHLGGDSISAILFLGEAGKTGITLAMADVFAHPTLQAMAKQGVDNAKECVEKIRPFSLLEDGLDFQDVSRHYGIDPAAILDAYPCTPLQEGLLSLTSKRTGDYLNQNVLELSDSVDVEALCQALKQVARAMPVLRTRVIQHRDISLVQVVLDEEISWIDATCSGLNEYLREDRKQPMGLGEPLTRYAIVRDSMGTPKWMTWTIHHALYDGWSMALAIEALYEAFADQPVDGGPPFQNFIKHLRDQDDEQVSSYWKAYLSDCQATPFPAVPPSLLNQPLVTNQVVEHSLSLPQGRRHGATASTLVRAAWAVVAGHMSGSHDVVFGVTVSGRSAPVAGLDRMAAPTIATVPVRLQLHPDQNVSEFLAAAQQQVVDMIPFEQTGLQRIAKISSAAQKACMFQTLLVVQPEDSSFGPGPLGTWLDGNQLQWSDTYALTLEVRLGADAIATSATFDPRVVDRGTAQRLLQRLDFVFQQLDEADPGQALDDIEIVSPQDLDCIWEWNKTVPPPAEHDICHMFADHVKARPDAPAVCAWDGELTYRQADQLATGLQARLVELGVGPGILVPLCFEKSMWTTVAILGVVKAGGGFVLLDPALPEQRLRTISQQVKASLVLSSVSHWELASRLAQQTLTLGHSFFAGLDSHEARPSHPPCPSSVLYIIFTSGSTGTPKGVQVTYSNMASALHHQARLLDLTPDSRIFDFASYSFDVSISNLFSALTQGGCLCVPSNEDRKTSLEQSITAFRANVLDITPTVAQLLSTAHLTTVRTVIFSGEALHITDVQKWWQAGIRVFHLYGPSECTPTSSINHGARSPQDVIPIGKGAGLVTWVVSPEDHDELLPPGCVGELLLEGPLVGLGYLADPQKTAASFIKDPVWLLQGATGRPGRRGRLYKTGDLVRYTQDGQLVFVGRKDSQTKIRGQRVELEEVEHHVRAQLSAARQVVAEVITVEDEDGGQTLVAFLTLGGSAQATAPASVFHVDADFEMQLAEHLPSYMIPTWFLSLAELPTTPSGKTDRKKLREIGRAFFKDGAGRSDAPLRRASSRIARDGGPITETEQPAYALAQQVLGMLPAWRRASASLQGNLDQGAGLQDLVLQPAGLDSVNVMSLLHYISREFGVKIGMELLMDRTTSIRTLAAAVSSLQSAQNGEATAMLPGQLSPSLDLMAEISRHDSRIAAVQQELVSSEAKSNGHCRARKPLTVLLTGANGFIGSQILRQLLESRDVARVVALVRAETDEAAAKRTIEAAARALWWTELHGDKLQVWAGDLSLPRLGLDAAHWSLVSDGCSLDAVIHNGAEVHWGKSYATLEATNVSSTMELLEVAVKSPRMHFVYVSGGRDRADEDEPDEDVARELEAPDAVGYSQTKFVSEVVVRRAAERCRSTRRRLAIVMPGLVVGTPAEGVSNADDYLWRLAASCIRVGAYNADAAGEWLHLSDVATMAAMIVDAALSPGPETQLSDGMRWGDFWALLRRLGYPLEPKGAPQWLAAVRADMALVGETHPLWPLTHILEAESLTANNNSNCCQDRGSTPLTLKLAVRRSAEFLWKCGFLPTPLPVKVAGEVTQAAVRGPFSRSSHGPRPWSDIGAAPGHKILV